MALTPLAQDMRTIRTLERKPLRLSGILGAALEEPKTTLTEVEDTLDTMHRRNPITSSRAVLAALFTRLKVDKRPFGGVIALAPGEPVWDAEIADGNAAAHLATRVARFGISLKAPPAGCTFDDGIINLAAQLVNHARRIATLTENQAFKIAVEYVTQTCFMAVDQVQRFADYVPDAVGLRDAYKRYNKAAEACTDTGFEGNYPQGLIQDAINAAREIRDVCGDNAHLATLRASIQARVLPTEQAWNELKAMTPATRRATILELLVNVATDQIDQVDSQNVAVAAAKVTGYSLVTGGDESGFNADAVIATAFDTPFANQVHRNGGSELAVDGMPATGLASLAGLRGTVATASVKRLTLSQIKVTAVIDTGLSENASPAAIGVPMRAPWFTDKTCTFVSASASA